MAEHPETVPVFGAASSFLFDFIANKDEPSVAATCPPWALDEIRFRAALVGRTVTIEEETDRG